MSLQIVERMDYRPMDLHTLLWKFEDACNDGKDRFFEWLGVNRLTLRELVVDQPLNLQIDTS